MTYLNEWLLLAQFTHSGLQLHRPLQAASKTFALPLLPPVRRASSALFPGWLSLLLPELSLSAASSKYKKAAETAGRLLVQERYASCVALTPEAVAPMCSWRGLAKCWTANTVWQAAAAVSQPAAAVI